MPGMTLFSIKFCEQCIGGFQYEIDTPRGPIKGFSTSDPAAKLVKFIRRQNEFEIPDSMSMVGRVLPRGEE
jgi:hypothetical protein